MIKKGKCWIINLRNISAWLLMIIVLTQQDTILSKEKDKELQHVFLMIYSSTLKSD